MAEPILAAVALGVAIPSIVVSFAQCGEHIKSKVAQYKQAPSTVIKVGTFGHELYSGLLKENLVLASWAYSQDDVDDGLKDALEDQIEQLRTELIAMDKQLDKCFDIDGNLRKARFWFSYERKLKATMTELEQWQRSFQGTISLIGMRRALPEPLLLTRDKFKIEGGERSYDRLKANSHIWIAKGQLLDGALREVDVLIEQKPKITTSVTEIRDIASCLSRQHSSAPKGLLRCLGYREEPQLELVFELPSGSSQLRTMEDLIQADVSQGYAGHRPLDYRFRLAHQIAEAVLSVHTSKRVHKNIRLNTILMIDGPVDSHSAPDSLDFGIPYLTDWTMLRKIETPSSMVGENDWLKDIYRHPRRQGLQPEHRYNMGHDIYSLGVCLLAIGLWEPLITINNGFSVPSDRYIEAALRLGLVKAEDVARVRDAGDNVNAKDIKPLLRALTKPPVMHNTLKSLAEYELPARMGLQFTHIVGSCLSCLEGDFGDINIFQNSSVEQAVAIKFNSTVLQSLSSLVSSMGSFG